jgi:hypothetical protein
MTIREIGKKLPRDRKTALPVFSTDTVEEATALMVLHCKLAYFEKRFVLIDFSGNYEDLDGVSKMLEKSYEEMRVRAK